MQTITLLCPSVRKAGCKPAGGGKLVVPLFSPVTTARLLYLAAQETGLCEWHTSH